MGRIFPAVNDAEHGGYKKQGGCRRKEQTADDGPAQGRILFAAFAKAEGHGHHADDHGQGRHHYGTQAGISGLKDRGDRIIALGHPLAGVADHENAVGGGHAHAHDGPRQRRDA